MNARLHRSRTVFIAAIGVCTLSLIGTAISAVPKPPLTLATVLRSLSDVQQHGGNELTALDALHSTEASLSPRDHDIRIVIGQLAAQFDAVVGSYREALREFPVSIVGVRPAPPSIESFPPRGWHPEPALSVLGSKVGDVNIVMLNEAHHVPQDRAFAIELLPLLRKKGFR